jgi:DNA-directed RNA polymerase specialized sigma24 family protein
MESSPDRVERLLALLLVQQTKTLKEKIVQLSLAGFTATEIADLTEAKPQTIHNTLYEARKAKKKR